MKRCSKCLVEKSLDKFSRKKDGLQPYCRDCSNILGKKWYYQNKVSVYKRIKENKKANIQFIIEYLKNHSCVDCGETDIIVLEFDHLRDKFKNVTKMAYEGYSIEAISQEITKCEVVCANDHKRRTATRSNWSKLQQS